MTLIISKQEIEIAFKEFIQRRGFVGNRNNIKINIICGKGEKGVRAEIEEYVKVKEILKEDVEKEAKEEITVIWIPIPKRKD